MTAPTLIDVADAVVADLNAASFSQEFEAVRRDFVRTDLKDLAAAGYTVEVAGLGERETPFDRDSEAFEYDVTVALRKKLSASDTVEEGAGLLGEIRTRLRRRNFADPGVSFKGFEVVPWSSPELDQTKLYLGVLKITYQRVDP